MFGPDLGHDGSLTTRGWALFEIDASDPREVERFVGAVDAADRAHVRAALHTVLRGDESFAVEFHTVHPVGQQRLICARALAQRSPIAEAVRLSGVLVDITHVEPLSREMALHTHQMTRMTHARLTHVGLLLGSLTHELNQPLMAILSNSQAGIRFLEAAQPDLEELHGIFCDVCEDTQRAVEVVRGLRTLYQGDKLTSEDFDLNEAVREVSRIVNNHLVINNATLSLNLSEVIPLVRGHRVQIQQVVLNLVYNACEAMEEFSSGRRKVIIRSEPTEMGAMISVIDFGKGIDKSIRNRVFDPFFTTKPAGMGMGLDVCLSIVEAHGGKLWFRDRPGGGTIFSFTVTAAVEASI